MIWIHDNSLFFKIKHVRGCALLANACDVFVDMVTANCAWARSAGKIAPPIGCRAERLSSQAEMAGTMSTREAYVYTAKLAEQSERYDGEFFVA